MSTRLWFAAAVCATASATVHPSESVIPPSEGETHPLQEAVEIYGRQYEVVGGDIIVDRGLAAPPTKGVQSLGNNGVKSDRSNRWPNLEVVYKIDWTLSDDAIDDLGQAIAAIEAATCVTFRECTGSDCIVPYANVRDDGDDKCYSEVAVNPFGQPNVLNLGLTCGRGATIHELLHTLGIFHEHQRSDRDNFIFVNYGNIKPGMSSDFDIKGEEDFGSYDYRSIMHYRSTAFGINNQVTIVAPPPFNTVIGQRNGLSPGDIATIDHIYGILPGPFDTSFNVEIRCNDFWEQELHVFNSNPNNVNGNAHSQFNLYDYTTGTEVYLGYINGEGHFPTTLKAGHTYYVKHGVWNCKAAWQESRIYSISLSPSDIAKCTPSLHCGELALVEIQRCVTSCGIDKKSGEQMIISYFGLDVSPHKCHNGIAMVVYTNTDSWPTNVFTSHFYPWRNVYCTAGVYNIDATIHFKDGATANRVMHFYACDDDVPV